MEHWNTTRVFTEHYSVDDTVFYGQIIGGHMNIIKQMFSTKKKAIREVMNSPIIQPVNLPIESLYREAEQKAIKSLINDKVDSELVDLVYGDDTWEQSECLIKDWEQSQCDWRDVKEALREKYPKAKVGFGMGGPFIIRPSYQCIQEALAEMIAEQLKENQ